MAYRSSSTNSGSSAAPSVAVPAGVVDGDIILAAIVIDNGASTATLTGFTQLFQSAMSAVDGQKVALGWRRASGDSGSYTWGNSGAVSYAMAAVAFSGRDASNPPTATENKQDSSHTSPVSVDATGVTALDGDDLCWIDLPDPNGGAPTHTAPTGYTLRVDVAANSNFTVIGAATKDAATAGATGTVTGTLTLASGAAAYCGYLVRIPLAAPASTAPLRSLSARGTGGRHVTLGTLGGS